MGGCRKILQSARAASYLSGLMLLPIAHRELRVSARNKATHRLRLLFAVGAVTIAGGLGLLLGMGGARCLVCRPAF